MIRVGMAKKSLRESRKLVAEEAMTSIKSIIPWSDLRVLACLRRIAKALEWANELEQHRQELEFEPFKEKKDTGENRKVIISHPTVQRWNDRKAGIPE